MRVAEQVVSLCAVGVLAGTAMAVLVPIGPFPIEGSQEVGPVVTDAMGTGSVTLDTATNMLSWDIQWQDLSAPITGMHFHGPAPVGVNAGIQVNIGSISGLVSPSIGSTTISAAQASDLLAGLWYVNIHSEAHPGGEIRGQVVPGPAPAALLALGGLAGVRRRR